MPDNSGYFLDRDDSGHWYVVPVSQAKAWQEWLDSTDDEDFCSYAMPEGVEEVGGHPSLVSFPSYEIDRT